MQFNITLESSPKEADIAIVSINDRGDIGNLNTYVFGELGYSTGDLPNAKQLANGYYILNKKPVSVVFIVTVASGIDTSLALKNNLAKALSETSFFLNKKIWTPLMGTGVGNLSYRTSYDFTMASINAGGEQMGNAVFTISIPNSLEGRLLYNEITNYKSPRIFVGGSYWSGEEQSFRFFSEGIWENGHEEKFVELVDSVEINDILILKSTYITPDTNYLRIKGVGVVTHNSKDGRLTINWNIKEIQIDIKKLGHYRSAFAEVRKEDLTAIAQALETEYPAYRDTLRMMVSVSNIDPGLYVAVTKRFIITETIEGVLGVKELAIEFANLVKSFKPDDKGKMIGIFGQWGRGKTFLMDTVWEVLKNDKTKPFDKVKFHAWKYQDTQASWAYLYESFAKEYFKTGTKKGISKWWHQWYKKLELNYKKIGPHPILGGVLLLIIEGLVVLGAWEWKQVQGWMIFFGLSLPVAIVLGVYSKFKIEAKDIFRQYFNRPSFSGLLGVQSEIQAELKNLLQAWLPEKKDGSFHSQIILFVDDIDRCSEDRIIQIIDALRVLLEDEEISKRVIVVAAVDERILKRAIQVKYHSLIEKDLSLLRPEDKQSAVQNIVTEYIDKLFISGLKLGKLTDNERLEVYEAFTKNKVELVKKKEPVKYPLKEALRILTKGTTQEKPKEDEGPVEVFTMELSNQYELTQEEDEELRELLIELKEATPRQIRIFYYRYLLSRNLLYNRIGRKGIKRNKKGRSILGQALLYYTLNYDHIENHKKILLDNSTPEKKYSIPDFEEIAGEDQLKVLEVLEMVVAY